MTCAVEAVNGVNVGRARSVAQNGLSSRSHGSAKSNMTKTEHLVIYATVIVWSLVCVAALTVITRSICGWFIDPE